MPPSTQADVPISVLDTSPIVQGSTARTALHNTVDLARLADELGITGTGCPNITGCGESPVPPRQ